MNEKSNLNFIILNFFSREGFRLGINEINEINQIQAMRLYKVRMSNAILRNEFREKLFFEFIDFMSQIWSDFERREFSTIGLKLIICILSPSVKR